MQVKSVSKNIDHNLHRIENYDFDEFEQIEKQNLLFFYYNPDGVIEIKISERQKELAKEVGVRRTAVNSKWTKRSEVKTNSIQHINQRSVFTADELGALGEIILRDYLHEDFESEFAPLLTENETGLTDKEKAADILHKKLGNLDVKTVEYYRDNISIKKKQLTDNRYDGIVAIKLNEDLTKATIKFKDLKCEETIKSLKEMKGKGWKPNYYLLPF